MTRIILVLNPDKQETYTFEDSRSHRELVKAINTGELVIGEGRIQPLPEQQWAMSHFATNVITVVPQPPPIALTRRQYDVLFGLYDGLDAAKIAENLGISRRTVYMNISHLKERLQSYSRFHLVGQAVKNHLLPDELGLAEIIERNGMVFDDASWFDG